MKDQKKRILLSVTGMSPAVVTETLYALVTEKSFIPTEIRVITTLQGKNKVLETLLGVVSNRKERKGALEEFIEDYGKQYGISSIHFDESCIEVIEDSENNKLPDIRTPEENQLAADKIVKLMGELCQDDESAIHVSIAGGRKTMGFFLGYALSLYGRKQDSLSHVLVSPEFENVRDFYYPKPYSHKINDSQGKELDASEGKVMLAEIPWVRLGLGLPSDLLGNAISYSDSVNKAQQILEKPTLKFLTPIDDRLAQFGNQVIKLSPRGYALLLSLVISKIEGREYDIDDKSLNIYLKIYEQLKDCTSILDRLNIKDETLRLDEIKNIFSESRNDIQTKVKKSFSIGKSDIAYIPKSVHKRYELFIELEDIDLTEIQSELKHLKPISN
ncbi:CRISPR-associated protein, NE0113 family [Canicola haemoglobinophilus]|uniref:CRISPR-associated protein, NE0113 family n=1 Tax=Canicola haemoglobinophilus TaxID=733 RepID=A0AB38H740_9PAST|nr:CRISPR-associated ring nuclease Csm6 [Canicola haemoglobinophilus]STO53523.1 CRISPR-associated protein, NE0113 family [Canicola haemoglobinophilus]STO68057.1 CRISPR-associated protein, NE0113 family [Canicola haemoglobinophilus]